MLEKEKHFSLNFWFFVLAMQKQYRSGIKEPFQIFLSLQKNSMQYVK